MGTCTLHALAMRSSLELRDAVRLDPGHPASVSWRTCAVESPCIPVFHRLDMHHINAPEKPLKFNGPILVQNS
jgi:hypothetical protein